MTLQQFFSFLLIFTFLQTFAQTETVKPLPYGNMDHWMVREIEESFIIGGHTVYLYAVTDERDTLHDNTPYINKKSPWASSSVFAHVNGVKKGSVTVFPEKRPGHGFAARLETRVERVKVLGIININVLASGTLFLGQMKEPITDTKNPQAKLVTGIPFTEKPDFLQFDYKVKTGGPKFRINGLSKTGDAIGENDKAEIHLILQKRWEDKDGNVFAHRLATGWERLTQTQSNWQNNHRIPIEYGDITKKGFYQSYMRLRNSEEDYFYTENSKGKSVPIQEVGWGAPSDTPTHLILQFSSSNGGAYIGSPDSKLWIDNVQLVYEEK